MIKNQTGEDGTVSQEIKIYFILSCNSEIVALEFQGYMKYIFVGIMELIYLFSIDPYSSSKYAIDVLSVALNQELNEKVII